MGAPTIEFRALAERADLRGLIESDRGAADRSRKYACPFHEDSTPSLTIAPDGKRWKCWGCGESGDALDWLVKRDGLSLLEAAKRLDPSLDCAGASASRPRAALNRSAPIPAKPAAPPAWHAPAWQAAAAELVDRAERTLWGTEGREALAWLRGRGLDPLTIRRFQIGFLSAEGWTSSVVPRPDGTVGAIHHERGILIPWTAPRPASTTEDDAETPQWCGANVRRLNLDVDEPWSGGDKCKAIRGSERGHFYPWPEILDTQPTLPALVVEGEFDALLGVQEAGHVAHVGTVGGAGQRPTASALAALARCPWWLIATDHDEAGVEAAWGWRERAPQKARRVLLPIGKDLGEFVQGGGDVPGWLAGEMARLGLGSRSA